MGPFKKQNASFIGAIITLGIVYGDIGTSPLYVIKAISGERIVSPELVLGGLSCVFYTLLIITSFKYIFLALNADNKGEGGIFALYAILRKKKAAWIVIPAIIGCGTLIADGFITPSISISSAIEGLRFLDPKINTIPLVLLILVILFIFQQFGTNIVGKTFGPMMVIWFLMLAVFGTSAIIKNPVVLKAINPMYALRLLTKYPGGFWLLGLVFLCTTGAEALYSDMGHCGKQNIRLTWIFVCISLLISYFGQSAWLLQNDLNKVNTANPFFGIMPDRFIPIGIAIATIAAIIASQALISGIFSLVSQAIKLELWTELKIKYPSIEKGQVYLPAINWFLLAGCISVILIFKESSNMEAAYGLAIMINMLMTTCLLIFYLSIKTKYLLNAIAFGVFFLTVEGAFFISNLEKLNHGGAFSLSIASVIVLLMIIVQRVRTIKLEHKNFVSLKNYLPVISDLQADESVPLVAENLVFLAKTNNVRQIDANIIYSIFKKQPKRARVYWFLHVEILDEPFIKQYSIDSLIPGKCFFVQLKFGFKVEHRVNVMFSKILEDLQKSGEIDSISQYQSLRKHKIPANFKFIILSPVISSDFVLKPMEHLMFDIYKWIKKISLPKTEDFGLELSNVEVELIPIKVSSKASIEITRIKGNPEK